MIYIIGGCGFVGLAIVRACQRRGQSFQNLTHDIIDQFTGTSCELLINANGNSKKFMADRDPLWEFDASVRSVRASLANIHAARYVYLSSCDVYPDCSSPEATREEQALDITKQSAYGFHKYLAEQCVIRNAPEWLIFRMGGFVGPGLKKNAVYDILNGGPLWLSPESALQFIHVDIAADIILDMALSQRRNDIFNLCGTGVVTLSEVMSAVEGAVMCRPDSPRVHYEVSTEKLCGVYKIPESRQTVLAFVQDYKKGIS